MCDLLAMENLATVLVVVVIGVLVSRWLTWIIGFLAAAAVGVVAIWVFGAFGMNLKKQCTTAILPTGTSTVISKVKDAIDKGADLASSAAETKPKCYKHWENGRMVMWMIYKDSKKIKYGRSGNGWVKLEEYHWDNTADSWVLNYRVLQESSVFDL